MSPRAHRDRRPRRSEDVERDAALLLERLGVRDAPIPVDRVAALLGLHIERTVFGDDVSGVLVINQDKGVIGVNASQPLVRQRFTIAHEIAHYELHREELPVFIDKQLRQYAAVFRNADSSNGEDRREREANRYAAALLMPLPLLREEIAKLPPELDDEEVVESLAARFNVSKQAMSFRIANAGHETSR